MFLRLEDEQLMINRLSRRHRTVSVLLLRRTMNDQEQSGSGNSLGNTQFELFYSISQKEERYNNRKHWLA